MLILCPLIRTEMSKAHLPTLTLGLLQQQARMTSHSNDLHSNNVLYTSILLWRKSQIQFKLTKKKGLRFAYN